MACYHWLTVYICQHQRATICELHSPLRALPAYDAQFPVFFFGFFFLFFASIFCDNNSKNTWQLALSTSNGDQGPSVQDSIREGLKISDFPFSYLPVLNTRRLAYAILGFQISHALAWFFLQSFMGNYDVSTRLDVKLLYCVRYKSASNCFYNITELLRALSLVDKCV